MSIDDIDNVDELDNEVDSFEIELEDSEDGWNEDELDDFFDDNYINDEDEE